MNDPNVLSQTEQIVPIKNKSATTPIFLPLLISVFLLISIIFNFYFYLNFLKLNERIQDLENQTENQVQELDLEEEIVNVENEMVSTKVYNNNQYNFTLKIPEEWIVSEQDSWVGFTPKEVRTDVLFAINIYKKSDKTNAEIIDSLGKQFPDRIQKQNKIVINDIEMLEIITTEPDINDWYYRAILIEDGDYTITLSNGALSDKALKQVPGVPENFNFETFLQSFEFFEPSI